MADNTTRLKILAQVEGVQGFDSLKRSLQGLAQQGQQSGRSLDRLYTSYQQLSGAGKNSISSLRLQATALAQLRDQAELGSRKFRILTQDLERVEKQLQQTTRATRGAAPAVGGGMGLAGLAGQFAPQLAVGAAVAGIATAGVSAESAQVRLKALTDQFGEYNEAQAAAARIAGTLRMSTAESQQSFADLYASLRPTGITVKELENTLIGFSAAARNSGATAQETSNALIQLKQGLASGALQGEELRSIREQAPLAAQAIAKEMGTTIGNLKNLAAEGKVTTDVVIRAMGRLKEEQLGKLNAQFNTAEQAMTDAKNAAVDLGAEISKLFGPTVVSGLRLLTGALNGINQALDRRRAAEDAMAETKQKYKGTSFYTPAATSFYNQRRRELETQYTGPSRLLAAGSEATYTVGGITYNAATGRPVPGTQLTAEARQSQEEARLERLRAGQAGADAGKAKEFKPSSRAQALINAAKKLGVSPLDLATIISFETSGTFSPSIVGGEANKYQGLIQFGPPERVQYGMNRQQTFEEQVQGPVVRYFQDRFARAGKSTQGADLLKLYTTVLTGSPSGSPNAKDVFETSPRSGVAAMGPHRQRALQMFFGGKLENVGYSMAQAGEDISQGFEATQKLAEQRAKEQADYNALVRQERAETKDIEESMRIQVAIDKARTDEERIRLEYTRDYFNTYRDLTREVEGLSDAESARKRIAAADALMYQKQEKALSDIAALEQARNAELMDFSSTNSIMQSSISAELQKQADAMERQRNMAEGIASTIGQGFSQAFDLAIQGSEDWKRSLSEIASGVLRDIAKQLIEIAVINTITKAVTGMISPAPTPAQNVPGYGSAGFLGIGTLPQGSNMPLNSAFSSPDFPAGFVPQFATGGIMTPQGAVPLRRYARGGIATAPQAAIYGEGATPEAFVPLPDGRRIPVALRQYPGIPGAPGTGGSFEQTDAVVQRLVETARQESAVRAATGSAAGPDGTMRIQIETTRINSVDYVTAEQAQALAQAAATRSTARQQRALQGSPAARRSVGI